MHLVSNLALYLLSAWILSGYLVIPKFLNSKPKSMATFVCRFRPINRKLPNRLNEVCSCCVFGKCFMMCLLEIASFPSNFSVHTSFGDMSCLGYRGRFSCNFEV